MPNQIYNVKQAAKILGLSTNTTYKYLNEGRIKATRGHIRGTFIITAKSLETFLGCKLSEDSLNPSSTTTPSKYPKANDVEAVIEVIPPTLAIRVSRVLIAICLILIIIDIILTQNFSPVSSLTRIALIFLVFLISYQFGGFVKK